MHLNEETLSVEEIFKGKILNVTKDKVLLENSNISYREVIHHNGGVCVVPVTDEGEIIFVKQFRYPFKTVLTEVPAGKLEKGENPRDCGIRELKEETGAEAEEFIYLGCLYPTVAYNTEIIHMYLAKGLSYSVQNLDEDEFIDVVKIPLEEAYNMAMTNQLPDSKTQLAVMKAYAIEKGLVDKDEFIKNVKEKNFKI